MYRCIVYGYINIYYLEISHLISEVGKTVNASSCKYKERRKDKSFHIYLLSTTSVVKWSGFLATDPEVRVRIPTLPGFMTSSGSGMKTTQLCEHNRGAT
jgi:hypothetical protein